MDLRLGSARPETAGKPSRRWRLVPALPIAVLTLLIIAAVAAPLITPYDPLKHDLLNTLSPPSWMPGGDPAHFLGTDQFGRDVWTRLLYGTRISLSVTAISLVLAILVGTVIGVAAGYVGGWLDSALMRFVDMMMALPKLLVAMVVAIAVGGSFRNLVLVLGLLSWQVTARVLRGDTLALKQSDFVRYPVAIGVPNWAIAFRHVVPNVVPSLLVVATLEIGGLILAEAALSFLGVGVPPPTSSWGVMISDGQALIATGWWIALFPGLAIGITVLASNTLGDWLRDHFDPKTRLR